MSLRSSAIIGVLLIISTLVFSIPITSLSTDVNANSNGWFNTQVSVHINATDTNSDSIVKEIRYCLGDTNSTSDGCRVSNVIAFTKTNFGTEKDCITDKVCITRGDSQGLYNSVIDSNYNSSTPSDTEWHFGSFCTDGLDFNTWVNAANNNPSSTVNKPGCLHLVSDDLYFDINFTKWAGGAEKGGAFSYVRTGLGLAETIPKSAKDFNVFTSDLNITMDGNTMLKYYAINDLNESSIVIETSFAIDSVAPTQEFFVVGSLRDQNGNIVDYRGTTQSFSGGRIILTASMGTVAIPSLVKYSDALSGIDECAFNFDFDINTPQVGWQAPISKENFTGIVHHYTTLGEQFIAMKCTDNAGNSTLSISCDPGTPLHPVITINVTGTYPAWEINISPQPVMLDKNIYVDLNIPDGNQISQVQLVFTNGDFNFSTSAVKNPNGTFSAVVTPSISWPEGTYHAVATLTDFGGLNETVSKDFNASAPEPEPTPITPPTRSGGSVRSGTITPIPDTNAPDANVPLIDNNANDNNDVVVNDRNEASNFGSLEITDTNTLEGTDNASPTPNTQATGFFGLFGENNGGWIMPLLIILLALFIVALYVRRDNFNSKSK